MIAAPTGSGKTHAAAKFVATQGNSIWLADRVEDVDAATETIQRYGGQVGRVLPLKGNLNGVPNCLHPDTIEIWQKKGYSYRRGFCPIETCCERRGDPERCAFLKSIDNLKHANNVVVTKAMARDTKFFTKMGNGKRPNLVLDENFISLMRQPITIGRFELRAFLDVIQNLEAMFAAAGIRLHLAKPAI